MKKLLFLLALIPVIASGQITVSGNGAPTNPYIIKWKVKSVDTTFASPTNTSGLGAALGKTALTSNYTYYWQVHYNNLSGSTGKMYPLTAAAPGDTLQTILVDTTSAVCLMLMTDPASWRNRQFIGEYLGAPYLYWHYSKGSNSAQGWIFIYQVFKPKP